MAIVVVEVLCVGNELLSGITVNTNAHWISSNITESGGFVRRITVVGDDVNEISCAVKESIAREPNWLILSGGLGPTYDDKTLEGVAMGLGLELILDGAAVEMLKKNYARRSANYELNEASLKMAKIPRGSTPIQNPVGTAPTVQIKATPAKTMIICLPGVPKEMEAIFLQSILPQIKKAIGEFYFMETSLNVIAVSEVMLSPTLSKIVESNPPDFTYIKTHPYYSADNNESRLRVQLIVRGSNKKEVETRYNKILSTFIEEIQKLNGKIKEFE
jgi:molybdenum cofactor synthesis domain-containing protein